MTRKDIENTVEAIIRECLRKFGDFLGLIPQWKILPRQPAVTFALTYGAFLS
jgi:hypothetical protein